MRNSEIRTHIQGFGNPALTIRLYPRDISSCKADYRNLRDLLFLLYILNSFSFIADTGFEPVFALRPRYLSLSFKFHPLSLTLSVLLSLVV